MASKERIKRHLLPFRADYSTKTQLFAAVLRAPYPDFAMLLETAAHSPKLSKLFANYTSVIISCLHTRLRHQPRTCSAPSSISAQQLIKLESGSAPIPCRSLHVDINSNIDTLHDAFLTIATYFFPSRSSSRITAFRSTEIRPFHRSLCSILSTLAHSLSSTRSPSNPRTTSR